MGMEYGALFLLPNYIAEVDDVELKRQLRLIVDTELEHAEKTAQMIYAMGSVPSADLPQMRIRTGLRDILESQIEAERAAIESMPAAPRLPWTPTYDGCWPTSAAKKRGTWRCSSVPSRASRGLRPEPREGPSRSDSKNTRSADIIRGSHMNTIFDMNTLVHTPMSEGEDGLIGAAELVKGKFGKACRFDFLAESRRGYFSAPVKAGPEWDEAAGLSFWMKGDGTPNWGGMELVDRENPRLRYQCEFPINSTEWQKISIPWGDFMPFLPDGQFLDPANGHRPSRIGTLRFGKQPWWYEWPAYSFTVDQIQLEPAIEVDRTDYTPTGDPLAREREVRPPPPHHHRDHG